MTRDALDARFNRPEHWGVTQVLQGPWAENQARTVLYKPPYKRPGVHGHSEYCVPVSQSILLTSKLALDPANTNANWAMRWVLGIGGGGTRTNIKIDMLNTQQLSVAGENLTVEALCEKADFSAAAGPFQSPGALVATTSVTVADGNVSSGQATYTQGFTIFPGATELIAIPPMATSFRIAGSDPTSASSPYSANVIFFVTGRGPTGDAYIGNVLTPPANVPFIPIQGLASLIQVINSRATPITFLVVWGLDL
jgi:hypothetical protein